MIEVRLHGFLADKYGPTHYFHIDNPRDAARALRANFKEFEKDVCTYPHNFHVANNDEFVNSEDGLIFPTTKSVDIIPVIQGQVVGGMIAAGAGMLWASTAGVFAGMTLFGLSVTTMATSIGLSLVLSGVARLLTKPPQPMAMSTQAATLDSFGFGGAPNTAQQGARIPLIYGRVFASSVVVSVGIDTTSI
jgi:predicted phage tail protein